MLIEIDNYVVAKALESNYGANCFKDKEIGNYSQEEILESLECYLSVDNGSLSNKAATKKENNTNLNKIRKELLVAFPGSFFNEQDEFIAHLKTNTYFIFKDCTSREDICCKIIEWFSRPIIKGGTGSSTKKMNEFRDLLKNGTNKFLGTNFTYEDFEDIYCSFGNAINHNKTIEFVKSGYNLEKYK